MQLHNYCLVSRQLGCCHLTGKTRYCETRNYSQQKH